MSIQKYPTWKESGKYKSFLKKETINRCNPKTTQMWELSLKVFKDMGKTVLHEVKDKILKGYKDRTYQEGNRKKDFQWKFGM